MKLYRIFIPKYYSDGDEIEIKKIRKLTETIREKFGAYSLNPFGRLPLIQGLWTNKNQKLYTELMYLIEIFVEDTFDNNKWLRSFQEMARQDLRQESLFVIVQNAEVLT